MCEIIVRKSEGHSAQHGPTVISSIFGPHTAVNFSETPPPHSVSQEAINMFFFYPL